ncbi:DUF2017 domain-containing protein [Actinomadura rayongensis]|uniref:DUF2017 family protein n=1 Tax=Actinomadura rayongensis TaxID=1429076 RepID=A0A6I4W0A2_9ACTN|nr:DUF2017 domain-containing protein [Actinomadura rayongensis]MXQ62851.1 DUF2017 family protein [Actinomadura rayongensis]
MTEGVVLRLEPQEAHLLRLLMEQMLELLGDAPAEDDLTAFGIASSAKTPSDPVLLRLFPDGYSGDDEASGEFRRYTELGLREGKREAARTILETLDEAQEHADGPLLALALDGDRAEAWLRALNDVRLVLGTRLDIDEDWYRQAGKLTPDDPRTPLFAAYELLTMMLEELVDALG